MGWGYAELSTKIDDSHRLYPTKGFCHQLICSFYVYERSTKHKRFEWQRDLSKATLVPIDLESARIYYIYTLRLKGNNIKEFPDKYFLCIYIKQANSVLVLQESPNTNW